MTDAQQYYTDFYSFVKKESEVGTDLEGHRNHYIRYESLQEYWTIARINKLLDAALFEGSLNIRSHKIRTDYLIPLSVLVFSSSVDKSFLVELQTFVNFDIDDHSCPIRENEHLREELWSRFDKHQWRFCPIRLGLDVCFNSDLDSKSIFPGLPHSAPDSWFHNATLDLGPGEPSFQPIRLGAREAKSLNNTNHIVIKSYPSTAYELYKSEYRAYNNLQDGLRDNDNILRCYGHFNYRSHRDQTKVYNLVLEQANGGSLADFYEKCPQPQTFEEIKRFWSSLVRFLCGLAKLHNGSATNSATVCVHQDLKPSNILIFYNPENPHEFVPKLHDFGQSTTTVKGPGWYNSGTSTYSPPEILYSEQVQFAAKSEHDRWAAACILVDAAVWVKDGLDGQEHFAGERRKENQIKAPQNVNLGRSDCFHDNNEVLDCVRQIENEMRYYQFGLSADIVRFVLSNVLEKKEPEKRMQCLQILTGIEKTIGLGKPISTSTIKDTSASTWIDRPPITLTSFDNSKVDMTQANATLLSPTTPPLGGHETSPELLGGFFKTRSLSDAENSALDLGHLNRPEARKSLPSPYPRTGSERSGLNIFHAQHTPTRSQDTPALSKLEIPPPPKAPLPSYPVVSIEEANTWRLQKKQFGVGTAVLRGKNDVLPRLERDHIFLIDDSRSMKPHKTDLLDWFRTLVYVLKEADDDGVEVVLTSDGKKKTASTTTELENYVKGMFKGSGPCNMELCLDQLFARIIEDLPNSSVTKKKKSFRFLERRVPKPVSIYILTDGLWTTLLEEPIRRLVQSIALRHLPRSQVVLQFLRFGEDPAAIHRLDYLDNFLEVGKDIVDHKSTKDGIWQVLVGALDQRNDQEPGSGTRTHSPASCPY